MASALYAPPSVLPDISPSRGEIGSRSACAYLQRWRLAKPMRANLPPVGEMSAGQRGALSRQLRFNLAGGA